MNVNISSKELRETIFKMVEIVESGICNYMKDIRGALMYDVWTNNDSRYLAVYEMMRKKVKRNEGGQDVTREELAMPLLSISTISERD